MSFLQGDGEFGLRDGAAQVARQIEVSIHGVLAHVLGDLLAEDEAASLLQAVVAEPAFPPAQENENGALEEAVKIDDDLVGPVAERAEKTPDLAGDGRAVPAFPQIPHPALAPGDEDAVQHRVIQEKIRGGLLDGPADVGLRVAAAQRRERRQRVDHVPDGAEFDDEDVHRVFRSSRIHRTASRMSSAMKAGMSVRTMFEP